jgi:hypothetical protein
LAEHFGRFHGSVPSTIQSTQFRRSANSRVPSIFMKWVELVGRSDLEASLSTLFSGMRREAAGFSFGAVVRHLEDCSLSEEARISDVLFRVCEHRIERLV